MTEIDKFVLRNPMGHTITGTVCRDGSDYVLSVSDPVHKLAHKRFKSLESVYGYCEGRGWRVGLDRADRIRKAARRVLHKQAAEAARIAADFQQTLRKNGMVKGKMEVR